MTTRAAWLLLLLAVVLLTPGAAAQTEGEVSVARRFFQQGLEAEKQGHWRDALTAYEKAIAIRDTPQLGLRAGLCLEKLGRLAQALVRYERAQEQARLRGLDEVRAVVVERLDELRPRVPTVVIVVKLPVEGLRVSLDDAPLAAATYGTKLPVDPGEHVIRAAAPGHHRFERRLSVVEGDDEEVTVVLKPAQGATSKPGVGKESAEGDAAVTEEATYLPSGLLLGSGVALMGGAAVLLVLALGKESDIDDRCGGPERLTCPASERDDIESTLDDASLMRVVGYAVGGVGAAAAVAGIVLLAAPPTSAADTARIRLVPAPGVPLGVGIAGSF